MAASHVYVDEFENLDQNECNLFLLSIAAKSRKFSALA